MSMHDGGGSEWMVARAARVAQLRALPDDHDRPEPGWRRRLERAPTLPVPADLLEEHDQTVMP